MRGAARRPADRVRLIREQAVRALALAELGVLDAVKVELEFNVIDGP